MTKTPRDLGRLSRADSMLLHKMIMDRLVPTTGIILVVLLAFFAVTAAAGEATDFSAVRLENNRFSELDQQKKNKIPERKISEQNRKIQRLQEGILRHKMKILNSKKKERELHLELDNIESRLSQQRRELTDLHGQQGHKRKEYDAKLLELEQTAAARDAYKHQVEERLAAYYRMGSIGMLNVVFSAERLPDLLGFQEYFQRLMQHDRDAIRNYQETITLLAHTREELGRQQEQLEVLVSKVRQEETQLADTQQAKGVLLAQANTEHQLFQQAVTKIEKSAADLASTLKQLRKQASQRPPAPAAAARTAPPRMPRENPVTELTFAASKGRLAWPVQDILTTTSYDDGGRESAASGIDIKAAAGSPVRAVFNGIVIHSGFLQEYGNMLIIDHGDQYYSIMSRLGEVRVAEGSRVTTGQVVAVISIKQENGLHFEIRHGATSEDPTQWLQQQAAPMAAEATQPL